jgi:glutamine synthetase
MSIREARVNAKINAISHTPITFEQPEERNSKGEKTGRKLKVSEYFGECVFDIASAAEIPENIREELISVKQGHRKFNNDHAAVIAKAVTDWATSRGATHFTHWFQPLTGGTAEKHDAFLEIKKGKPIEELSASKLLQGEPDASSFPNGGSRSTFEARGYTTWDISSPMFLIESTNGKTLCIPTAFVSYRGEALDIKTPLLRSISRISEVVTDFLQIIGNKNSKHVVVTAGCEQEYFLVDRTFFFSRPDLVMTGRTVFGSLSAKNQQLEDHYFGSIDERTMAFMQEVDLCLHRLGVSSKTRHNEVAPGQFELAPIFVDANVAADQNQLIMSVLKKVATKHNFEVILHEKPFAGINGSGKHVNWSISDNTGLNLLEPGTEPHQNHRFLAVVSIICEAVKRHGGALRMAIASASNDHRLGANEAPPSIISVYLGDTLEKIYQSILDGKPFTPDNNSVMDMGARQLADLLKDNTDRNRTSPFAFTGNKFEFRAVGSKTAVGLPMTVLNAAVSEVFAEANAFLKADIESGKSVDESLAALTKKYATSSKSVVFNGDGYSEEWIKEAERRGLPNHRTTPDALKVLLDEKQTKFLTSQKILSSSELNTRFVVLEERYEKMREIEFKTLISMVHQNILPAAMTYKNTLGLIAAQNKSLGLESEVEVELLKRLNELTKWIYSETQKLSDALDKLESQDHRSQIIASELLPMAESVAIWCNKLEEVVPNDLWSLPKYYDMLFLR